MSLVTGQVLQNRYRVVKLIRRGGFGAIYRAWDMSLKKPCAIKANSETSSAAAQQFTREAAMLANLNHPNLPRVTDHFIIEGMGQYLVMDFVEGEDLQDVLDRSQSFLPEAQVLAWIKQVGEALAYMHNLKQPVIHRDIKPANIRITPEGKVSLVDFGIAKEYARNMATAAAAKAVTAGFSPPEQYSGAGTDNRSDIYALGATLYNLLTGEPPIESVLRVAKLDSLRPPRSLNPAISPSVEAALIKAMDVNPDNRFQRIEDFIAALSAPWKAPVAATQVSPSSSGGPIAATMVAPGAYGESNYPATMVSPGAYGESAHPATGEQGAYGQTDYPYAGGQASVPDRPKSGLAKILPWALGVVGVGALILLVVFGYMLFGGGDDTDSDATQTRQAAIALTENAPKPATDTKAAPATYTPYPTYTPLPTSTSAPVIVPTSTPRPPDPTDTKPPPTSPPTSTPTSGQLKVSIRNRTTTDVNYYRISSNGQRTFLGWVPPNYYGTYPWPSLGTWTIEFCARDADGNSYNCRQKTINVTSSGQEFSVP